MTRNCVRRTFSESEAKNTLDEFKLHSAFYLYFQLNFLLWSFLATFKLDWLRLWRIARFWHVFRHQKIRPYTKFSYGQSRMVIKAENMSKGFVSWYLQQDVDNHMMLRWNNFPEKYKKAGGKISGFVKESFTLQNVADSKVFGYKVLTLNSGFKISGDATKSERFYYGFVHLCVNGKKNPVPKRPGFVTNPQKSPQV